MTLLARHWPVVMEREVQIGSIGRSDLQIRATTPDRRSVKVAIEIKIQDHEDVHTAMERQLVLGYMSDPMINYGIYLIGWYACAEWKPRVMTRMAAERERYEREAQRLAAEYPSNVAGLAARLLDCRLRPPASRRMPADSG